MDKMDSVPVCNRLSRPFQVHCGRQQGTAAARGLLWSSRWKISLPVVFVLVFSIFFLTWEVGVMEREGETKRDLSSAGSTETARAELMQPASQAFPWGLAPGSGTPAHGHPT